jgi:hypothetical protein
VCGLSEGPQSLLSVCWRLEDPITKIAVTQAEWHPLCRDIRRFTVIAIAQMMVVMVVIMIMMADAAGGAGVFSTNRVTTVPSKSQFTVTAASLSFRQACLAGHQASRLVSYDTLISLQPVPARSQRCRET